METVHSQKPAIIHRDLKPANILYRENGRGFELKIIDFGLAMRGKALGEQQLSLRSKAESDKSIVEKDIAGTLLYAPPEQMGELPDPVGTYSDVYSFGMTLKAIFFGDPRASEDELIDYPDQDLVRLIGSCKKADPKKRLANFSEVLKRLENLGTARKKREAEEAQKRKKKEEVTDRLKREKEELAREVARQRAEAEKLREEEAERQRQEEAERQRQAEEATQQRQAEEAAKQKKSQSRYTVTKDGVIQDSQTGLEWYVGPDKDTNWDQASAWVDKLKVAEGGWRMPTRWELEGLYDPNKVSHRWAWFFKVHIDPVFKMMSGVFVWSGEIRDSSSAWGVDFYDGREYRLARSDADRDRAFAVRSRR
jgi:serine/threonine protein kinase